MEIENYILYIQRRKLRSASKYSKIPIRKEENKRNWGTRVV